MVNLFTYHLKNKAIRLNNLGIIANEKIEHIVDASILNYEDTDELNNLVYKFKYRTVSGELYCVWADLFLYPIDKAVENVVN